MAKSTTKAPANKSAAPGSEGDAKAKKEKVEKVSCLADGKRFENIDEAVAAYDSTKHKPLKKGDFKILADFFEFKAREQDAKAAAYRKQAEEARKLGKLGDPKKANRLKKALEQVEKLKADLGDDADDVIAELMKEMTGAE